MFFCMQPGARALQVAEAANIVGLTADDALSAQSEECEAMALFGLGDDEYTRIKRKDEPHGAVLTAQRFHWAPGAKTVSVLHKVQARLSSVGPAPGIQFTKLERGKKDYFAAVLAYDLSGKLLRVELKRTPIGASSPAVSLSYLPDQESSLLLVRGGKVLSTPQTQQWEAELENRVLKVTAASRSPLRNIRGLLSWRQNPVQLYMNLRASVEKAGSFTVIDLIELGSQVRVQGMSYRQELGTGKAKGTTVERFSPMGGLVSLNAERTVFKP